MAHHHPGAGGKGITSNLSVSHQEEKGDQKRLKNYHRAKVAKMRSSAAESLTYGRPDSAAVVLSNPPSTNALLRNLWTSLFGEGKTNIAATPQTANPIRNLDSSTEAPISAPSLDDEINVLARHFGGIVSGNTYEIELRELLSICPRQRKRADAYYLLKKLLKDRFNVDLVITSRTNKSTVNHEKED